MYMQCNMSSQIQNKCPGGGIYNLITYSEEQVYLDAVRYLSIWESYLVDDSDAKTISDSKII
jgi:hypothetical protein